jgi:hypothetical protein
LQNHLNLRKKIKNTEKSKGYKIISGKPKNQLIDFQGIFPVNAYAFLPMIASFSLTG